MILFIALCDDLWYMKDSIGGGIMTLKGEEYFIYMLFVIIWKTFLSFYCEQSLWN